MTTYRKTGLHTETKRVVNGVVKVATCACAAPAAKRRECADATGNKTPCRCFCHSDKLDPFVRAANDRTIFDLQQRYDALRDAVRRAVADLDAEMTAPPSTERGERIAAVLNRLDAALRGGGA